MAWFKKKKKNRFVSKDVIKIKTKGNFRISNIILHDLILFIKGFAVSLLIEILKQSYSNMLLQISKIMSFFSNS